MKRPRQLRRGLSPLEVLVVVVIVGVVLLLVLMRLPRSRETARDASCKKNLMQIGIALAQYHADAGALPTASLGGHGPLRACLLQLAIPDFTGLTEVKKRKPEVPGFVASEKFVPGFVCPTDTHALTPGAVAPISYRASTGSSADGLGGAFALGVRLKFAEVDDKDGLSFTAAFSERLVGDETTPSAARLTALNVCPGPIVGPPCPSGDRSAEIGRSWWTANWDATLYNHLMPPNSAPSCRSVDGKTGNVAASSMHPSGVNVLLLDGSVRSYGVRVNPKIWSSLGTIDDGAAASAPINPSTPKAP